MDEWRNYRKKERKRRKKVINEYEHWVRNKMETGRNKEKENI